MIVVLEVRDERFLKHIGTALKRGWIGTIHVPATKDEHTTGRPEWKRVKDGHEAGQNYA